MNFQSRTSVLQNWTACSFGDTITKEIPREFHLEGVLLQFEITAGATPPVIQTNKEGFAAICDSIRLEAPTGSTVRAPLNTTSSGQIQIFRALNGQLDRHTMYTCDRTVAATWSANEVRYMTVPCMFVPPNLDDPAASLFLLPLPRYTSNPTLRFTVSAGANIITVAANATLRYRIVLLRRFVDLDPWPTFEVEQSYVDTSYASALDNAALELPSPGVFTLLLGQTYDTTDFRTPVSLFKTAGFTAASAAGNVGLPWTSPDKVFELKFTGVTIRSQGAVDLQAMQDYSTEKFPFAGQPNFGGGDSNVFAMDFLSDKAGSTAQDFGSALDTNPIVGQGARVTFSASPTLPSGSKLRLHFIRVFGDVSPLRRGLPVKRKK